MWMQYAISGAGVGCLYGLVGMGFALVYRTTRIFHVGLAAIFVASGYCQYVLERYYFLARIPALLLGVVAASLIGVICELGIFRCLRRRGASWSGLFVASLGIYIFLANFAGACIGSKLVRTGNSAYLLISGPPISITGIQLAEGIIWLGAVGFLSTTLKSTFIGREIRAIQENVELAEVLGANPNRAHLFAALVGSFIVAVAGAVSAMDVGITPHAGFTPVLAGAIGAIVGGRNAIGAAFGGLLLGMLQAFVVKVWAAQWQQVVVFGLLAVFLLAFGTNTREQEAKANRG